MIRRYHLHLKDKFYRMVVRPSLLYGVECWPVKNSHVQKMQVAEMRMLRWMCGHTRCNKIRNEVIREKVEVTVVADKMREARLRWFGHVQRRSVDTPPKRLDLGVTCSHINMLLSVSEDITLGRDSNMFVKVSGGLLLVSILGGLTDFLTLGYTSLVIVFTNPALYEKCGDQVDVNCIQKIVAIVP